MTSRWTLRKARARQKRINEAATREILRLRAEEMKRLENVSTVAIDIFPKRFGGSTRMH